jgi:hypothetical protein
VIAVAKKDKLDPVEEFVIRALFGPKSGRVSGTQQVDKELHQLIDDQKRKEDPT